MFGELSGAQEAREHEEEEEAEATDARHHRSGEGLMEAMVAIKKTDFLGELQVPHLPGKSGGERLNIHQENPTMEECDIGRWIADPGDAGRTPPSSPASIIT